MRIVLLHNPCAGSEDHTGAQLSKLIRRAGHELVAVVDSPKRVTEALAAERCDVVLVAGGDGTVGRTACAIAEWGIPLAILPSGTANNTASTLKIPARPKWVINNLANASRVPFDLATFDDGSQRQRFCEALGWGLFSQTVERAKQQAVAKKKGRDKLARDRELFRSLLEGSKPRAYEVEVDGSSHSGDYLMLEVLNVPLLGPRLLVSPHSDPSDGALEVLLAGESDRAALREVAETGQVTAVPLPFRRGKVIRVRASDGLLHRDGGLLRHPPGARDFEIRVHQNALHYLR
jgi:diacylglycerol kinase family enzyme